MRVALGRAVVRGQVDRLESGATADSGSSTTRRAAASRPARSCPRHAQLGRLPARRRARRVPRARARQRGGRAAPARQGRGDDDDPHAPGAARATTRTPAGPPTCSPRSPTGWRGPRFTATVSERCRICPVDRLVPGPARGDGASDARGSTPRGSRRRWAQPPPTAEQVAVIEAPPRPTLVIAGAGSGKTETMAARVVWLVANGLVEPDQVLGLTFTRKAAAELSERIDRRLDPAAAGGPVGARARRRGPRCSAAPPPCRPTTRMPAGSSASTASGSATRPTRGCSPRRPPGSTPTRRSSSYDGPMDLVDKSENTVTAAVVDLAGEMAEHLRSPDEVARAPRRGHRGPRGGAPGRDDARRKHPASRRAGQPPAAARRRAHRRPVPRSSSGLATRWTSPTRWPSLPSWPSTSPTSAASSGTGIAAVLLDEFQDTSEAQLALLRALFATGPAPVPVTAVGDPHQSIYGWRGASATTLTRFPEAFATSAAARPRCCRCR